MKINLIGGGSALPEDVVALERIIGVPLDKGFLDFVRTHDGAEPEKNYFLINTEEGDDSIQSFIAVKEISAEMKDMNLPPGMYPVAFDSFGNYIVIDGKKNGFVYFWDHEESNKLIHVANSFDKFITLLDPDEEDIDSTSVDADDPGKTWKHPDFDTMFAEYLLPKRTPES